MKKHNCFAILLSIFVIFLYIIPYFIFKHDSVIPIFDNLDSYFVWYKVLSNYPLFMPMDSVILNFLDGIPRNAFHSELMVPVFVFKFLSPFASYIFLDFSSRIIAFVGMYLLLKDYFLKDASIYLISFSALCFALLPNYLTMTYLTILGQPLLVWAFMNIRKGNLRYYNWLILLLMPFGLNFELITPFLIFILCIILIVDCVRYKKLNRGFLFSVIFFTLISLISVYRYLYLTFFADFVSHRVEIDWAILNTIMYKPFFVSIINGLYIFMLRNGETNAYCPIIQVILPVVFFTLIFSVYKKDNALKSIIILLSLIAFISGVYGIFSFWKPAVYFVNQFSFLKQFQINRFYIFIPLLWYIVFSISLFVVSKHFKKAGMYVVIGILFCQLFVSLMDNTYFSSAILSFKGDFVEGISYKQYFAEEQFDEISDFINEPKDTYRVLSIDLPLNILAYNGFYTINGYFNLYSLDYKNKFLSLVEPALQTEYDYAQFLKYWGHKLVVLPNENKFDYEQLKSLKCKYIFSGKELVLKNKSHLKLLKVFDSLYYYKIYVYKVL